jgi:DNA-binding MarR family transcriptional regulator
MQPTLERARPPRNTSTAQDRKLRTHLRAINGQGQPCRLTPDGTLTIRVGSGMGDIKTARALQALARALGRLGRERARAGDITPQQAEALQLVADRGAMSTSSVALVLGIDPSTASRNLAGLERRGYIVRRRGADDGRQTDVRLTPRGKRTAEAVSAEWIAASALLFDRLPRQEHQRIAEVIEALARVLDGEGGA